MATTRERPFSSHKSMNKKSFDYKMCKKVAELTQVVHMLFTKSHEKDIELALTRKAYEKEIADIVSDAQCRMHKLRITLEDERRRCEQKYTDLYSEQVRDLQEQVLRYTEKLEEYETELLKAKKESFDLQQKLKSQNSECTQETCDNVTELDLKGQHLPKEMSTTDQQNGSSSDTESLEYVKRLCSDLEQTLREKDAEIERLKELKVCMETENLNMKTELIDTKKDKDNLDTSYNARILALQTELSESMKTQSRLQQKVKTLGNELKAQRKELQKPQPESGSRNRFSSSPRLPSSSDNLQNNENSSELERLRKELDRYRLELSNREGNFNRMFTTSNPVRVDSRLKGLSFGMTRQKSVTIGSSATNLQQKYLTSTLEETQKGKDSAKRLPLLAMEGRSKTSSNLKQGSATGDSKALQFRDKTIARRTDIFQQAF